MLASLISWLTEFSQIVLMTMIEPSNGAWWGHQRVHKWWRRLFLPQNPPVANSSAAHSSSMRDWLHSRTYRPGAGHCWCCAIMTGMPGLCLEHSICNCSSCLLPLMFFLPLSPLPPAMIFPEPGGVMWKFCLGLSTQLRLACFKIKFES